MDERDIRKAIHSKLLRHCHRSRNTRVIDELGLHHGKARIDIAVINGNLCGIEIKSAQDDLSRLPSQIDVYILIFNKITLVLAEKFLDDAKKMVPPWWGLVTVTEGPRGGINLNKIRVEQPNKNIKMDSLARLLWRDEVISLLESNGITSPYLREPRSVLYNMLIETINYKSLHKTVCTTLKHRENWRNHLPL